MRLPLCPILLTVLCSFARSNYATTIAFHEGSVDPVTTGWTLRTSGGSGPITVGPVTAAGVDAWFVDDNANGDSHAYQVFPSPAELSQASLNGWRLSANLRVVEFPDPADFGVAVAFRDGSREWALRFGADALGNTIVNMRNSNTDPGISVTIPGTGFHQYDLIYDPTTATADLFIDSALSAIQNMPGDVQAIPADVIWGSGSTPQLGHGQFHRVEFVANGSAVPDASSSLFLFSVSGSLLLMLGAFSRSSKSPDASTRKTANY